MALFGEGTYGLTERLKVTLGARYSDMKYSFDTLTGGPQLFAPTRVGTGNQTENAFTPKASLQFQADPTDLYYSTYAKGFRPGGANNPLPHAACPTDFANFGIQTDPQHLQLRHRQQLRDRREEQLRQPRAPRDQHLLHPLEQHPAAHRAAGLPDLLHRQYR